MERFEHHEASLRCADAKPNCLLESSKELGWKSLLLDYHQGVGECEVFETHPTPDVTLVVAIRGRHRVDVLSQGHWRSADYRPGASGLTPGMESTRMRWSSVPGQIPFQTAHLYLSSTLIASLAEEYRRAGSGVGERPLSSLLFRDPVIASGAAALLDAMSSQAPDLYAEQLARWLATHLLANHAGWWDPTRDRRQSAVISDRRLARTIEFMSARLGEPLTMDVLAREAGISVHHFARKFREQTGFTPYGYLVKLRMEAAEILLRGSDLSVAEIAHKCGYARPAAFAAAFLRNRGTTPTSFRDRSRKSSRFR